MHSLPAVPISSLIDQENDEEELQGKICQLYGVAPQYETRGKAYTLCLSEKAVLRHTVNGRKQELIMLMFCS